MSSGFRKDLQWLSEGKKKKVNTTKAHRDNMIGTIIKGRTNKNINETEEG